MPGNSTAPSHHLSLVTVLVPDYDEAIAYYTRTLGFELIEDTPLPSEPEPGKRWVVVAPPGARETRLLLARAATPAQRARVGDQVGGRVGLFLHTTDFETAHARMRAAGVEFEEEPRDEPYGIVAVFRDLYGNRWDLLQPATVPPATVPPSVSAMTVLVATVIVHDEATDRIVMLQRGPRATFGRGLWDLPTGKSEPGEPITATAIRELQEETGLVAMPGSLRMVHVLHGAVGVGAPNGYLVVVFETHEWSGILENREPAKHAQVRWADLKDVPTPLVPSTDKILHAYPTGGPALTLHRWD